MLKRVKAPSPAMLVACLSLFVALGGVGYAAVKIDGKNIKNGTVTTKKLKNKSITGAKLKNNTLTGTQINESKLGKVPAAVTADRATQATTATQAQTALAISDDTVTSSKVKKGSLTGHDVGRLAGSTAVSINSVAGHKCVEYLVNVDPNSTDMRDDAFAVTAEDTWPTGLVFSTENSNSPGYLRINVCNVTAEPISAGTQLFHWVAFDV